MSNKPVHDHLSPRDAELTAAGWVRRFSAGGARLAEAAAGYRELGLEVLTEPVDVEGSSACVACVVENPDSIKVIYTRRVDDE